MKILVTGVAGFIGFHLAKKLLDEGHDVIGIDNLNDYYEVDLKKSRLNQLLNIKLVFFDIDLKDKSKIYILFKNYNFDIVLHMAAQPGVRFSIDNPNECILNNIVAFANIIDISAYAKIKHFIYASSSAVYGDNKELPFIESSNVDHPLSLYAASKKSNEIIAHSYSNTHKLPSTGLRFFTVYGPWGRPDMAYFKFVKKIINGEIIDVFGNGAMLRDFTYIDDIVDGVLALIPIIPKENYDTVLKTEDPSESNAPWSIFNIGNNKPIELEDFICTIETALGIEAKKNYKSMQIGDARATSANIDKINIYTGFIPKTSLKIGIEKFVSWYKTYYGL